jgi:predicted porin
MRKSSLGALVAAGLLAGGLSAGSASAADLGGNCCADLEERIAELEATTARKGNRKVSLTISGWVAEQVMWWDDGEETNVYVGGIGTTLASHFKFTGQATISPGWYAGYVIHAEVYGSETLLMTDQTRATGPSIYDSVGLAGTNYSGISTLQSFWFINSDHLGKVSVGKQSMASDNTAILVDGSGSLVPANYVPFDYGGFFLRNNATGALSGTRIVQTFTHIDRNGLPVNAVRYDSPTFAGFSVSASWGEDDVWDVAARYAGEFNGFKVAIAGAYVESTDEASVSCLGSGINPCGLENMAAGDKSFQIGAYVEHVPTGVFVYGAWGDNENDITNGESDSWYVKAGLRERWTPLGHTVLYGEYLTGDQENAAGVDTGDFDLWGLGAVQEIDAAAMSLWVSYRNIEAGDGAANVNSLDFQYVKAGALINF